VIEDNMRKAFLFGAVLFAGLIAGGQYLVWWDYDPAGTSAQFYTEKIQFAIRVIGLPLFSVQITTAIFTIVTAVLLRRERPFSYVLMAASVLCVIGVLLTFFGNIPLLDQMETWSAASPPANWLEVAQKWWRLHNVRFGIQLTAFILLISTAVGGRSFDRNSAELQR
jgi:uncharacterized membrane protein